MQNLAPYTTMTIFVADCHIKDAKLYFESDDPDPDVVHVHIGTYPFDLGLRMTEGAARKLRDGLDRLLKEFEELPTEDRVCSKCHRPIEAAPAEHSALAPIPGLDR